MKTIQGRSYTVQYAYDANGEVTEVTLPSGRTVTMARASDGLVSGVTTKATASSASETLASGVSHAPFGPLQSLTYGNGLQLTHTLDQNYWLSRIEVKATGADRLDLSFGRNANGQLTGVTDNLSSGRGATFGYADAGRLDTANGAWGDEVYAYDAAGNRTGKATTVGGTTVAENPVMSLTSNRVATVEQGGGPAIRTLSWRAGGDLAQAVSSSGTYDYDYNARKRLKEVRFGGVVMGRYGYDFRGLRVWRTVAGTPDHQHHYVFDPQGRLLAEHDGVTGDVLREVVWIDEAALAVIESSTGTATTYFIHTGQIGEPLIMTDGAKTKVWEAYLDPFGRAQVFNNTPVELGLRLPGQWEDPETGGLHQNWNRDYDPSLGRYIEADPLGIEAGPNVYAYVEGDPQTGIDPEGLQARSTPMPARGFPARSLRSRTLATTSLTNMTPPTANLWRPPPNSPAGRLQMMSTSGARTMAAFQARQAEIAGVCLAPNQPGAGYHPRVRERALNDPRFHNFPYSFDAVVLSSRPTIRPSGEVRYSTPGTINNTAGDFVISVNPRTGLVVHRTFERKK